MTGTLHLPARRTRRNLPWWAVITVAAVVGITTGLLIGWATQNPPAPPRATVPIAQPPAAARAADPPETAPSRPSTAASRATSRPAAPVITVTPRLIPTAGPAEATGPGPSQLAPQPPPAPEGENPDPEATTPADPPDMSPDPDTGAPPAGEQEEPAP